MAAYRAEIEIGVRGIRQLQDTTKQIDLLSKGVDGVNKRFSGAIQSLNAYNTNLARAAATLNKVNAGTVAEAEAVRQYVTALGQANAARDRQNRLIQQQIALQRKAIPTANAGFGVQGPALPPTQSTGRRGGSGRDALGNAIIGGAFPLLFGQGTGAALGGGIGGAVGGLLGGQFGFGLSLVGTALGQTFDNASKAAADFTKELKETGDATGALEQALGGLDKGTRTTIQNLARSGQQAAAAEKSFDALAQKIGVEQAEALKRAGDATTEWGKNFQTWLTKTYANVVILGEAIKNNFPTGPGIQARTSVFDIVEGQPPSPITTEAQDRLENLTGENALLERQVALSRLTADASVDQRLQLERQVALQQYVNEAVQLEQQLKQKLLSQQEYNLRLKQAELSFTREIFTVENAAQQARQRQAEEARQAAERAARAAEQAARERLQTLNRILGLEIDLVQESLTAGDVDIQRTAAGEGQIAALQENLQQLQTRLNLDARILDIQLEQALAAENISTKERSLLQDIYAQQRVNLEEQAKIKQRTLQLDIARLQVARDLADAEGPRKLQDITQQRETELGRLQGQLLNPFGGESLDVFNQQLDQAARRYETLTPLERELTDLQAERAKISYAASKQELQDLDARITDKTKEIQLQTKFLGQLDVTEQALLRQQQIYAKYGFITDELSRALSDSITGLITGTTTVSKAFGRMFENIGKAFIDMATQMLAQKLIFSLFGSLLGGLGGGGGGGGLFSGQGPAQLPGGAGFAQGFSLPKLYAEGGFVTGPTRALIGEGGEPEYVIPASKMRSAMGRYASGARGASVIPGSSESGPAAAGGTATLAPIDVRYSIERINSVDYVTADQFQRGMMQAAQQGAIQGERRAMRSLKNSAATRRGVGI